MKPPTNKSGQAVAELAIFGAIILFLLGILLQYGLIGAFRDYLSMATFREAHALSFNRAATKQASSFVSLMVIRDKPVASPQDPYANPDRTPVIAGASATYSNTISPSMENPNRDPQNLPGVDYKINNKWYGWHGQVDSSGQPISGSVTWEGDQPETKRVGYTTQAFGYADCPEDANPKPVWRQHVDKVGNDAGVWWEWKSVDCDKVEWGDNPYVAIDESGILVRIVDETQNCPPATVDENGMETQLPCVKTGYVIQTPQTAEINQDDKGVNNSRTGAITMQGLQLVYTKTRKTNAGGTYVLRSEDKTQINNEVSVDSMDTIKRKILLNPAAPSFSAFATDPETKMKLQEATSDLAKQKKRSWPTPF